MANYNREVDPSEKWLPVVGYEGFYEISNKGRVWGCRRKKIRVCNRWGSDYLKILLCKKGETELFNVHRLVAEAFIGPMQQGYCVNHKDGVKSNNNLDNLEYVTPKENTAHAHRTGLTNPPHGDRHYNTKIKDSEIDKLGEMYASGISQRKIAQMYGVCQSLISQIINRKHRKRKAF
jgi:hypothetical protein